MTVGAVAIGAHPDDVELGCGGILAKIAASGRSFAIVCLTRGELGSRGSAETRVSEAEAGAKILGAAELVFLDCGDGRLRHGEEEESQLIEVLRRLRPELVLGPPPRDRHPDHERAHRLVAAATYYSGLRKRGEGQPHRPARVLSYMLHDTFRPRVIVDVSEVWETKRRALEAHRSQFYFPGIPPRENGPDTLVSNGPDALVSNGPDTLVSNGPDTLVSSERFWEAIEGRARHYGLQVGCELGEALWAPGPLPLDDPFAVVGAGLR